MRHVMRQWRRLRCGGTGLGGNRGNEELLFPFSRDRELEMKSVFRERERENERFSSSFFS